MTTTLDRQTKINTFTHFPKARNKPTNLHDLIEKAWQPIPPFWPLKNLVACNPLQGFEGHPIEEGLAGGAAFFEPPFFPEPLEKINRETIKWCQAFFDEGQATIKMPGREKGLYRSWRELISHDKRIHQGDRDKKLWLQTLPAQAESAIQKCLTTLSVPAGQQDLFLTLLLTTLPGWAAHVKYRTEWSSGHPHPASKEDYLAMRIVFLTIVWPEGGKLIQWHRRVKEIQGQRITSLSQIHQFEEEYHAPLVEKLEKQKAPPRSAADCQMVFCIDVRSEPVRRAIEAQGNYETFGFAGFFGLPIKIEEGREAGTSHSCPVLVKPKHTVKGSVGKDPLGKAAGMGKSLYQSLKYTLTTPFVLAEGFGPFSGALMGLRTLFPRLAASWQKRLKGSERADFSLEAIPFSDQCVYAENFFRLTGFLTDFAPTVILCGHGNQTQNNPYSSLLDCGACGGRAGAVNAQILALILNRPEVRRHLSAVGIDIPNETRFVGALHNTTTNDVAILSDEPELAPIARDLKEAKRSISSKEAERRSSDWAETRPEWGLARNGSMIVAPRALTKSLDLEGRSFLHSYDWRFDPEGSSLKTILTAPMVVAQWINCQYLFSTLNNSAYGSGNKVTHNVTGKIGVMQGNASDLMTGLPWQSVYENARAPYHLPVRLMTVVYAPKELILQVIEEEEALKKLFGNGWVKCVCIDPVSGGSYTLNRDLAWSR